MHVCMHVCMHICQHKRSKIQDPRSNTHFSFPPITNTLISLLARRSSFSLPLSNLHVLIGIFRDVNTCCNELLDIVLFLSPLSHFCTTATSPAAKPLRLCFSCWCTLGIEPFDLCSVASSTAFSFPFFVFWVEGSAT